MNIYLSTEENFDNNGLGFLIDCLSANVVEELNGEYGLNITYPINSSLSDYLVAGNIIKADVGDNNYQLFRISQVEKDFKTISLYARHIYYDLLDNFIEDSAPTNLDCASAAKWLLDRAEIKTKFEVYSDALGVHSARYVRRNPVECFMGDIDNSLVNLYNVEIERDNFLIKFLKQRGNNKNVKLIIGKNIKDINVNIDISSLYTKIMPLGYDGLMLPEKYVSSPLINDYPTPKIGKYEFSNIKYDPEDEEAYHTLEEAYQALRDETKLLFDAGIDKPVINIKIDWLELSKTKEYYEKYNFLEKVSLGDTITAEILGLNFETRVIKTTYNVLTKQIDTFEIGTFKPTFQNTVNSIVKNVEKINPTSILEEARKNATDLLTSAMGGYVYKTNNEFFIMDTDDPKTATKVWRWNLNGLGYSKNGINGPYEIAITQDGSINADFITSGKINTNLIEGYEELVMAVNSFKDLTTEVENIGIINIDKIMTSELLFLHIYPTKTDLSYLYPSKNLFPSEDLFMTTRDLVATKIDSESGEDVEVLRYTLPCDLHYIDGNIKDEFVIDYENKQMYCIHRVGFNEDGDKVPLEEEQKEYFVYNGIQFEAGTYKLFMESFEDAYINVRYSKQNEFTSQFATHVDVDKSIVLAKDNITLSITEMLDNKYFTGAKIMMEINNDESGILIQANKLRLEGFTSINNSFSIDEKGNVSIHIADSSQYDPTFTIGDIDKGLIKLWNGAGTFSDYYGNTNIQGNGIQCARTPDGPDGGLAPAFQLEFDNENNSSILHFQGFESEILLEMYYGSTSIKPEGINTPQVTQTSLESQKKNFEIFNNALSIIEDIDIYKYNLKSEDDDHKKHIGFVIGENYNYSSEITAIDDKGKEIGVDTYSMSSLNTQAIKELLERIKVLERKVENG